MGEYKLKSYLKLTGYFKLTLILKKNKYCLNQNIIKVLS